MVWLPGATVDHLYLDENKVRPECRHKRLPPKEKELNGRKCKDCRPVEDKLRRRIERLQDPEQYKERIERKYEYRIDRIETQIERKKTYLKRLREEKLEELDNREEKIRKLRRRLLEINVK